MAGQSGSADVTIENVHTIGDIQIILSRAFNLIDSLSTEIDTNANNVENQLRQLRVDIAGLSGGRAQGEERFDLVDTKAMSPTLFNGFKTENFKVWAKKVKAYCNGKLDGYRHALELSERMGKDNQVDSSVISGWNWNKGVAADSKLHDMLVLSTGGEAQGIVESVPGRGFEAWRLLNVRYNSVGELYTYDKINSIMHQTPAKTIAAVPAMIAKFERDLKIFRERTDTDFPEALKLPILIQMIPVTWKKEFETLMRSQGNAKTYEGLAQQLNDIGVQERYNERRSPDDMDCDAMEKITQKMYEGAEPPDTSAMSHQQLREYVDLLQQAHKDWNDDEQEQEDVDWLGKGGKGKGKGKGKTGGGQYRRPGKGGGGAGGSTSAAPVPKQPVEKGAEDVQCTWCEQWGHFRRDCKALTKYKADKDAERAKKGDHSPYVPPQRGARGPTRGAGSLDEDYEEEVVGITGADEDADGVDDEEVWRDFGKDFAAWQEEIGDESEDEGKDWDEQLMCGLTEEQPEFVGKECEAGCECDSTPTGDAGASPTPRRRAELSWTAVSKSTPLEDLFFRFEEVASPPAAAADKTTGEKIATSRSFYDGQWSALSDLSDYDADIDPAKVGSAAGSALRTDEPAEVNLEDQDATRQGSLAKPTSVETRDKKKKKKRKLKSLKKLKGVQVEKLVQFFEQGTQTDIKITVEQGIQADEFMECEDPEIDGVCEGITSSPSLTGGAVGSGLVSDGDAEDVDDEGSDTSDSEGEDVDVSLAPGEIATRLKANSIPDSEGFYPCNPLDVELCPVEIKERRFKLKRGVTADSGAGD